MSSSNLVLGPIKNIVIAFLWRPLWTHTDWHSLIQCCIAFQAYGLWYTQSLFFSVTHITTNSSSTKFKTIEIFGMEFEEWLAINWTSNTFSCKTYTIFCFDVECLKHSFVLRSLWHTPKIIARDNRNIFIFFFFRQQGDAKRKKKPSKWMVPLLTIWHTPYQDIDWHFV